MNPDFINFLFEGLAGFFVLAHCNRLYQDKEVKGVSAVATLFFAAWGYWNLYYYPTLGQWWSFYGGIGVVLANTLWVILLFYYIKFPQPLSERNGQNV